jgi:hypothetical protein
MEWEESVLRARGEKYRRNRQAIIDRNLAELRRATSQKPLDFQRSLAISKLVSLSAGAVLARGQLGSQRR